MHQPLLLSIRFSASGLLRGRSQLSVTTQSILQFCAEVENPPLATPCSLDVLYCSVAEIRRLNNTFRNINEPTDVLSFPAEPGTYSHSPEVPHLGDLAICLPYVQKQALANNSTLAQDTALFLVHGYLHLLGYDHATKSEEKKMFARQSELLKLHQQRHPHWQSPLQILQLTPGSSSAL